MYQAIHVKWLPVTNHRPMRLKAAAAAGSIVQTYDYSGDDKARIAIAKALAEKLGWHGRWFGGCLPDGSYCFVLAANEFRDAVPDFRVEKQEVAA